MLISPFFSMTGMAIDILATIRLWRFEEEQELKFRRNICTYFLKEVQ